jgi:hypothetical protein
MERRGKFYVETDWCWILMPLIRSSSLWMLSLDTICITAFPRVHITVILWANLLTVFCLRSHWKLSPLNSWNNSNHWNIGQNSRSVRSQTLLWLVFVASYLSSDLSHSTFCCNKHFGNHCGCCHQVEILDYSVDCLSLEVDNVQCCNIKHQPVTPSQ